MVEFALVLPMLCTLLLGAFDVGHSLYMQSLLQGTVQKASRDSSLETANAATQAVIDARVKAQVLVLHNGADVTFSRRYYRTFSKAAAATREEFTDSANGPWRDNICNNSESFTDANNNGVWDADGGDSGQGGARDKVVYTVTVSYPRMFPIDKFVGGSGTTKLVASTVLANQPFGDQASYGTPTVRQCPAA
ncbi:MAG: TadE/TadG family type IV pilus assembly protein [Sphingobium sp.]